MPVSTPQLTRFKVEGMRGGLSVDVQISDNTLILVGENGSGKTTLLRMLFYFLSGRWPNLAQFTFSMITVTIDGTDHSVTHEEVIGVSSSMLDDRMLRSMPPSQRRRVLDLVEQGRLVEAEAMASSFTSRNWGTGSAQQELFRRTSEKSNFLFEVQEKVTNTLGSQILYLPTYRRIERELSSIIRGFDSDEQRRVQEYSRQQEDGNDYVELVEFGMNDVRAFFDRHESVEDSQETDFLIQPSCR